MQLDGLSNLQKSHGNVRRTYLKETEVQHTAMPPSIMAQTLSLGR